MTGREVGLADLRMGELMAEGGEGRVHLMPLQPHYVLKLYRRPVDPSFLRRLVDWPAGTLTPDQQMVVRSASAWPEVVVEGPGREGSGLLVPRAPRRFSVRHRDGHSRLASLSYLTADPGHRAAAYGLALPPAAGPERVGIVYALARLLAAFESADPAVSHGDLSTKNVLWSLQRGPEVFVIDCDSAELFSRDGRPISAAGRRRAMTPNWDDPAVAPGDDPSPATDRYSLALIFLRVVGAANFPVQARQRSGERLEIRFPIPPGPGRDVLLDGAAAVWTLCARGLSLGSPRPSPAEWLGPLESLLDAMGSAALMRSVWAAQGGDAPSAAGGPVPLEDPEVVITPEPATRREQTWSKVAPAPRYGAGPQAQHQPAAIGYRYVAVTNPRAGRPNPASAQPRPAVGSTPTWVRPSSVNQSPTVPARGLSAPPGGAPGSSAPSPWMSAGASTPMSPEIRDLLNRFGDWWLGIHRRMWAGLRGRRRDRRLSAALFCLAVDLTVAVLFIAIVGVVVSPLLEG